MGCGRIPGPAKSGRLKTAKKVTLAFDSVPDPGLWFIRALAIGFSIGFSTVEKKTGCGSSARAPGI